MLNTLNLPYLHQHRIQSTIGCACLDFFLCIWKQSHWQAWRHHIDSILYTKPRCLSWTQRKATVCIYVCLTIWKSSRPIYISIDIRWNTVCYVLTRIGWKSSDNLHSRETMEYLCSRPNECFMCGHDAERLTHTHRECSDNPLPFVAEVFLELLQRIRDGPTWLQRRFPAAAHPKVHLPVS